ncbi:MAG TPA: ABC transporter ATP-binding protein [Firmicutes bacterium]|nr:ABC transporter ATP-binding protein [Bacillota bacterium]
MSTAIKEKTYTRQLDFALWKKLIHFIWPYKRSLLALLGFIAVVAGADALYPQFNRIVIDHYVTENTFTGLGRYAAAYGGLVAVQALAIWGFIKTAGRIETGLSYDIRKKAFRRLQELGYDYYDSTPAGWIMARMTSDITRLGEIISWGIVDVAWSLTIMAAMLGFMTVLNFKLTLLALSVVPLLAAASYFFQIKILKNYREVRKMNSRITGAFNEGITGAKTTKALVLEEKNLGEFGDLTGKMSRSSVRAAVLSSLYLPVVMTLGSIGTAVALGYGGSHVVRGGLTYGMLFMFISYTIQFFEPVTAMAGIFAEMQNAQAAAERVLGLIDTEPSLKDAPEVTELFGDNFIPRKENWPGLKGQIEFKNVSFRYPRGEEVLRGFNLVVNAGESVALVGETGSGKSTLVNLACRFYEPDRGEILIDDVDYRKRSLLWLHSHLGYVLQTPHLFSGTIEENIRYGSLEASPEEIRRAAALVNAHDFIVNLEKGYQTEVGEGGARLSTGQKQLISFARALLADPALFVLDEATSSVDTETEALIQKAITAVLKGRTSFIIAHRLSTIRNADRILVIRKGRITESGTHTSLIREKGYYYRLYTNQFMEERREALLE